MPNLNNSHWAGSHIISSSTSLLTVLVKELCAVSWVRSLSARDSPPKSDSLGCVTPALWLKSSIMWLLSQALLEICFIRRVNKRNWALLAFSTAPFENINQMGQRSTLPMSNKPTILFTQREKKWDLNTVPSQWSWVVMKHRFTKDSFCC